MAQPPGAERESLRSRLGIPVLAGNRRFVGATVIDAVGNGLIIVFTVVYFAKTTDVSIAGVGVAMTVARFLALPTALVVGPMIDRWTARRTAVVGNLVSTVGYVGFFFTDAAWSIVLVVFLVQVGHTTYWTSSGGLVVLAAPEHRRTRWFGFIQAIRNTGLGLGSALGAFVFAIGDVTGLYAIVLANAATFLLAAFLLAAWRPASAPEASDGAPGTETPPTAAGSYRTVLRDRRYVLLIGVNVTQVFAQMLLNVLLALYIVEALKRGAWLAGAMIVLATVQVALLQTVVTRWTENHRPTRVIALAAVLTAVAFALLALLYVVPGWAVVAGLVVAMIVFTCGEMVGFPAIDNLSVSLAPEGIRGRYLAVFQLSWTVGQVSAPALLTLLLAAGPVLPMLFLLGLSLLAIPMLAVMERMAPAPAVPKSAEPVAIGEK